MPELLLELGCEELPASFVRKAYTDLVDLVEAGLREAGIPFERGEGPFGTPRRLIGHWKDVAARQPVQVKESRGPGLAAAFDSDGNPTKALEGFCRGQGITPDQLEKRDGYVWVTKTIPGQDTAVLLAEILPQAIRSLTFDKSMRWGQGRMRFARPIRWILASYGSDLVSFDVEGVQSSLQSRGHRFYAPESFEAKTFEELATKLFERKVEIDPEERRKTIEEVSVRMASGMPDLPAALVDENVFLTEWPTPIEGTFREEYAELPEPVLVTAMAKHEKMFPVRGQDGKLLNKFVFVRNSGEDATVRAGSEWVLNARFNDAKFFHDEDKKHTMDDFLAKTEGIVFQEKLGTVRQRADRISTLAARLAASLFPGETEVETSAKTAGLYAKADLSSGLVGELANLQGIIGGEYARRQGMPEAVCKAIGKHYDLGAVLGQDDVGSKAGLCVLMADQIDKLVGYLGIGSVPSGSSDPFGLRRAVTMLIESSWNRPGFGAVALSEAVALYREQGVTMEEEAVLHEANQIFAARYGTVAADTRYDLLDAAVMADFGAEAMRPHQVHRRLLAVQAVADDTAFLQTASRPLNIVRAAREKGIAIPDSPLESLDRTSLNSPEGNALADACAERKGKLAGAAISQVPTEALNLKALAGPINAFFDSTMVMSPDEAERTARLHLLDQVCHLLLEAGDFTKVVIEGD